MTFIFVFENITWHFRFEVNVKWNLSNINTASSIAVDIGTGMLLPCQSVRHNILTLRVHICQHRHEPIASETVTACPGWHKINTPLPPAKFSLNDTTCSLWVVCICMRDYHNCVCVNYLELGLVYFLYVCECMVSRQNVINNGFKEPKVCGCSLVRFSCSPTSTD